MICDRPDRGPERDIVYGPPSGTRRHCWFYGTFKDALVANVLMPEHTQEALLAADVEHIEAAPIGDSGGPRFRAIERNRGNQGAIHVDLGSYAALMRCLRRSGFDRRHMYGKSSLGNILVEDILFERF